MTDRRPAGVEPVAPTAQPRGFRPTSRRRVRIAAGAVLAAVAIGGNVLLYASLDDKTEVLQVVRNVRAGETLTSEDLRIVEVDVDPTVPVVEADDIGLVVNQYARVFIASGTLIVPQLVQSTPLVTSGSGVVAVEIRPTRVPFGLRERSRVMIVVVSDDDDLPPFVTTGRVVSRGADADDVSGVFALSVEVAEDVAPTVAAGDDVRIVLLDPAGDPAMEQGG
jgi:hypothetical protein